MGEIDLELPEISGIKLFTKEKKKRKENSESRKEPVKTQEKSQEGSLCLQTLHV